MNLFRVSLVALVGGLMAGCAHEVGYMSDWVRVPGAADRATRTTRALVATPEELSLYGKLSRTHAIEAIQQLLNALPVPGQPPPQAVAEEDVYRRIAAVLKQPGTRARSPSSTYDYCGDSFTKRTHPGECRLGARITKLNITRIGPWELERVPSPLLAAMAAAGITHHSYVDQNQKVRDDKLELYRAFARPQQGRDYPGESPESPGVARLLSYLQALGQFDEVDYKFAVAFTKDTPEGIALAERFAEGLGKPDALPKLWIAALTPSEQAKLGPPSDKPWTGIHFEAGDSSGVRILSVVPGSPAAKASVFGGDLVVSMEGRRVKTLDEVMPAVRAKRIGDRLTLLLRAPAGSERNVEVVVGSQVTDLGWARRGRNIYETAIAYRKLAHVEVLLREGRVQPLSLEGVALAAPADKARLLELLLRYRANPRATCIAPGMFPVLERLLAAGADPNLVCGDGMSPLTTAIGLGRPRLVEQLLKGGAKPTAPTIQRLYSVLAGQSTPQPDKLELIELLKRHGADFRLSCLPPSALGYLEPLAAAGVDVNVACQDGSTPLLQAVSAGDLRAADLLLARGARADAEAVRRVLVMQVLRARPDPRDWAVLLGSGGLPNQLLPASQRLTPEDLRSLLERLLKQGKPSLNELRIDSGPRDTLLHLAARAELKSSCFALAKAGASVDAKNEYLEQPLDVASSPAMVEQLRALGARPGDATAIAALRRQREEQERLRREEAEWQRREAARREREQDEAEERRREQERAERRRERQEQRRDQLARDEAAARTEARDRESRNEAIRRYMQTPTPTPSNARPAPTPSYSRPAPTSSYSRGGKPAVSAPPPTSYARPAPPSPSYAHPAAPPPSAARPPAPVAAPERAAALPDRRRCDDWVSRKGELSMKRTGCILSCEEPRHACERAGRFDYRKCAAEHLAAENACKSGCPRRYADPPRPSECGPESQSTGTGTAR